MKGISVIVPVFNEAEHLVENLNLLISEIAPHFREYEIIVVSDGSTDGTHPILERFQHENVRKIIIPKNRGKGHAVRQGFQESKGDFVFFIDGGMELHPREIRIYFGLMNLYEADVVIGSKRHPQSKIAYPATRRALSVCFQFLIKIFFDLDVTDTQVGLKLFRRAVIDAILPDLSIDRYGFDLELLALAKLRGFSVMLEAPIRMDYFQKNQRSRMGELRHVCRIGMQIIADFVRVYLKMRKIRLQGSHR